MSYDFELTKKLRDQCCPALNSTERLGLLLQWVDDVIEWTIRHCQHTKEKCKECQEASRHSEPTFYASYTPMVLYKAYCKIYTTLQEKAYRRRELQKREYQSMSIEDERDLLEDAIVHHQTSKRLGHHENHEKKKLRRQNVQ